MQIFHGDIVIALLKLYPHEPTFHPKAHIALAADPRVRRHHQVAGVAPQLNGAFDHAYHQKDLVSTGTGANLLRRRPGHINRAIEVTAKLIAPFRRAHAHACPETEPLGIG